MMTVEMLVLQRDKYIDCLQEKASVLDATEDIVARESQEYVPLKDTDWICSEAFMK